MNPKLSRRQMCRLTAATVAVTCIGNPLRAWSQAGTKWPEPTDAKRIAYEAYIYAFPIVQNYLSIYQLALDPDGRQYKGPLNEVHNVARVFTPADTAIITPNSDTPYSYLIMDLRAEPIVVTLPEIDRERYYSLQLVDLYTNNVDYIGTREDGNGGGNFLITGPGWRGTKPADIKRVVNISTTLMFSQFRTQLIDADDIEKVKKIQSGYKARPLSAYLHEKPRPPSPKLHYPAIDYETFEPRFWHYTNFLLQFCPTLPSETELREKFSRIGLKAGAPWPPPGMPDSVIEAIKSGGRDAKKQLDRDVLKLTTSVGLFGTPEQMAGKYKQRALGALGGIYGNTAEEAVYPSYQRDSSGQVLDTSKFNYTLTFEPGQLPPVKAFWSVTMYNGKTRFLVENPLNRYLINSMMLPALKKAVNGSITLYLQHKSPGADVESNWLPAPNGPMAVVMRLYMPRPEVLNGSWRAPQIRTSGPV
ncbi:MAG TPA: DUF1254 domain-containing protein [Candidatus Binataceae bacterium]|nr:DUF1254 domain-containing protein [Candidatus Binataceae bacterium]